MASPEIEKKLSDLSADYIYNEGLGNILLLAISTVDRKATGDFKIPFEVPEEIKNIRKKSRQLYYKSGRPSRKRRQVCGA